jgi:PPM family protein phosphatase
VHLVGVGRSHVGLVRTNNEDAYAVTGSYALVCDGVGGRPAGEVASALAVAVFSELLDAGAGPGPAAVAASRAVVAVSRGNSLFTGMCCTLTGLRLTEGSAQVVHVGDSAAYLVRSGELTMVTEPQTVTRELLRLGEITAEEAATHPRRHTLRQAIGSLARDPEPEVIDVQVAAGDRVILATDGLDYVPADERRALLAASKPADELADALVAAALAAGGGDNVTVVVVDVAEN